MPATLDAPPTNDIVALLEDKEMPLADLAAVVPQKAIAAAWAAGLLEFGHKTYCVQGPADAENSVLIIEGGVEWSGPKTIQHAPFANFAAEEIPACGQYERADVPMVSKHDQKSDRNTFHRPAVTRKEAEQLVATRVRLTDKGLAGLVA